MSTSYSLLQLESIDQLIEFMLIVDNEFQPPLAKRVDLIDYVKKVFLKGHCYVAVREKKIVGMIMFYCNNEITKTAYITYLAVGIGFRNNGIGRNLMEKVIEKSTEQGMIRIGIHTWIKNCNSIRFYESLGYKKVCKELILGEDRLYMEKRLV